jgi:aldehyde:ferredoxin oxidoreductase
MNGTIRRVNVNSQTITNESVPQGWQALAGRALIPRILLDEIPPTCDPLGPYNKLLFVPGLLVGQMLSSCDRISVGGKSPLTGGVKEANAGGTTGLKLVHMGIKALIIEGAPKGGGWWTLVLDKDGGRFEPADHLNGLGIDASAEQLREQFGKKVAISLIGPAGEMRMASAGIQNLDKDGYPTRIAARGGLGAVMGSKHLKAIVFDPTDCSAPSLADEKLYKDAKKRFMASLLAHPQTKVYTDYGTVAVAELAQRFGAIPVNNFSEGRFENLEKINGDTMRDTIIQRGGDGDTSHACMPGCVIRSSNCFPNPEGERIVSPLEYETIGLVGTNLGIDSLDMIAELNREMNDVGVDTIEAGAALGVAAEAGLMEFGDGAAALELIKEIRKGTALGRVLGQGAATVGKVYGISRVPVVKGQALSAYDPRAIKGTGITYATSPQGADHTCGLTIRAKVDHLNPTDGQMEASITGQLNTAGFDTLGACMFSGFGFSTAPGAIRDLVIGQHGIDLGEEPLKALGSQTLKLELEFNRAAGFTAADDRLPEWMTLEPLPPTDAVFDVPNEDLDTLFERFLN